MHSFVYPAVHPFTFIYPAIHLFINLSNHQPTPPIHPFIYPCLSIHQLINVSIHPSIHTMNIHWQPTICQNLWVIRQMRFPPTPFPGSSAHTGCQKAPGTVMLSLHRTFEYCSGPHYLLTTSSIPHHHVSLPSYCCDPSDLSFWYREAFWQPYHSPSQHMCFSHSTRYTLNDFINFILMKGGFNVNLLLAHQFHRVGIKSFSFLHYIL